MRLRTTKLTKLTKLTKQSSVCFFVIFVVFVVLECLVSCFRGFVAVLDVRDEFELRRVLESRARGRGPRGGSGAARIAHDVSCRRTGRVAARNAHERRDAHRPPNRARRRRACHPSRRRVECPRRRRGRPRSRDQAARRRRTIRGRSPRSRRRRGDDQRPRPLDDQPSSRRAGGLGRHTGYRGRCRVR